MVISALLVLAVTRPKLLAHVMPWFEAPPLSKEYGYHWTMRHFKPPAEIASKFRPLIGLYDSGDPDVVECQVLQMKLAGFDGVLADWYGPADFWDYAMIHRNTIRLFAAAKRAGLSFGVVYEDQSVKHQETNGKLTAEAGPGQVAAALRWLDEHWISDPGYLRLAGKPAVFVFGPQYLSDEQWSAALKTFRKPVTFLTLHDRRGAADGAYDWPIPSLGLSQIDRFERNSRDWPVRVASAYPRFDDVYEQAGAQKSFPVIPDDNGKTYRETLARGLRSGAAAVQVATWNDWGEGTQIEPSSEFGYRDLEETQRQAKVAFTPSDLRLPLRLYHLRKKGGNRTELDRIAGLLYLGKTRAANPMLAKLER